MKKVISVLLMLFTVVAIAAALPTRFNDGIIIGNEPTNGALYLDSNGKITTSTAVDQTELEYLNGVTSSIQTQIDGLAFDDFSPMTTAGDLIYGGASGTGTRLGVGSNGQVLTVTSGNPAWEDATGGGGAGAYVNFGVENGTNWDGETGDTTNWSQSGSGTLASTSTDANVAFGDSAISWDAAAASDNLAFAVGAVPEGGNSGNCIASFYYKGFDSNVSVSVYNNTDAVTISGTTTLSASTGYIRNEELTFICPDDDSISLQFDASADAAIGYIDNVWMGENYNVGTVSQATFVGDAYIASTASCGWTTTSTTIGAFSTDSDCPGPTVISNPGPGTIQTTDSDLPRFTVNNLPSGRYRVVVEFNGYSGTSQNATFALSDGTTTKVAQYANTTGSTNSQFVLEDSFLYNTAGNRSFEVYGAAGSGTTTLVNNISTPAGTGVKFSLYRYPTSSETAFKADQTVRSRVRLHTHNGYGSTNNKIPRFSTTIYETGTAITYADASADGASFTINEAGIYSISFSFGSRGVAGVGYAGISLNSSQLTTAVSSITVADRLAMDAHSSTVAHSTGALSKNANWTGWLDVGDVIRPHTDGSTPDTNAMSAFTITQISNGMNAPLIKGAVVTSSDGVWAIESAFVSSSDVVSRESGDWIDGDCTNASTGYATCNFISGIFSDTPNCQVTAAADSVPNEGQCRITSQSSSAVIVLCEGDAGVDDNSGFNLVCHGPR